MKKVLIAGVALLALSGAATAHASDYPPSPDPGDEVVDADAPAPTIAASNQSLPQTGSDTSEGILAGAAVLAAGAGLVIVSRRRNAAA